MSAEVEATSSAAVVAAAADIICSLRGADLAGWTPPWTAAAVEGQLATDKQAELMAWPAVARGKRSRSRRRSPSRSAAKEGRWARGSPASPLDYSGGSGSGSGASTSGEDGGAAFCSPPAVLTASPVVAQHRHAGPTPPPSSSKLQVGSAGGGRRPSILPVPAPRPAGAGPRSRKKMRLPEVQQLVRSLAVENDGLREQMESLQRACTALSKENGKLETRLEHKTSKRNAIRSEEQQRKALLEQHAAEQEATNGFVLPDLNIPVDDMAD